MSLGDYIVIEEEHDPFSFTGCCVSTGTTFLATIDEDKRHLFADFSFPAAHPSACPFLRPSGDGRIICTIHRDSPGQCKAYRCIVMRVHSPDGRAIGRVTGTLALHSADATLRRTWEEAEMLVDGGNEEKIRTYLQERGYIVH